MRGTLYIGLGGTGAASVLALKKLFIDRYGEVPPSVKLLAIDTDKGTLYKEVWSSNGEKISFSHSEFLCLHVGSPYSVYLSNLDSFQWIPKKNVKFISNLNGVGSCIRSNARFVFAVNRDIVKKCILGALNSLPRDNSCYININIISSSAGGTGSGIFLDVTCLVKESLKDTLCSNFDIRPWFILPDVYREMVHGVGSAYVYLNAWATFEEIDYTEDSGHFVQPIPFGQVLIEHPLFDYAFVLGNKNTSTGLKLDNIWQITDLVAKCAFYNSILEDKFYTDDGIRVMLQNGCYDIQNKHAWASSVGFAELVFDSSIVKQVYVCRFMSLLAELISSPVKDEISGTMEGLDAFLDVDNLKKDLLVPYPEYLPVVDDDTTTSDINTYIDYLTGKRTDSLIRENVNRFISDFSSTLSAQIDSYIDNGFKGCFNSLLYIVRNTLSCITSNLQKCKEDLENNSIDNECLNWECELKKIRNRGLLRVIEKVNKTRVEILSNKIIDYVSIERERIRLRWAIRFYEEARSLLFQYEHNLESLLSNLRAVADCYSEQLSSLERIVSTPDAYQIYLHSSEVYTLSRYELSVDLIDTFRNHFERVGLLSWISSSKAVIEKQMLDLVNSLDLVNNAANVSIDDKLRTMPNNVVKECLNRLKILAAPLWSYNTQGYNQTQLALDKFVIVGVGNRYNSVLVTNPDFNSVFDMYGNHSMLESTGRYDRIIVTIQERFLPIYAVDNVMAYRHEYLKWVSSNYSFEPYVDNNIHNRIISENFNVMPTIEQDNILQLWVWGFVFGYIHFDPETNYYWIRSKSRGDAIHRYRFNLNKQRDVAFDIFKTEGLYHEIEDLLNSEISRHGNEAINQKIQQIKDDESYLDQYANISPLEQANLEDPKFKAVLNLVNQEISIMTNKL